MCLESLLGVENRESVLRFTASFARAEYALKRVGFVSDHANRADPEWDRFASQYESAYQSMQRSSEVTSAVEYLLNLPPRKQVAPGRQLRWVDSSRGDEPDLKWLLLLVRRVRNNLFHGGKFPSGPETDAARRPRLLESSVVVLDHVMKLDDAVGWYYSNEE